MHAILVVVSGLTVLILLVCVVARSGLASRPKGGRLQYMRPGLHHRDFRFKNSEPTHIILPGAHRGLIKSFLALDGSLRQPQSAPPVQIRCGASLSEQQEDGLRLTWFGHSTVLVEMDGHRVLTDPMLSERASPLSWIGPKRFFRSPVSVEDLPDLHAVVISHDHYDHLDRATITGLASRTGKFLVPLGVGAHLERWGISPNRVIELDWWQEARIAPNLSLVATPSRHFSGRGPFDRFVTLWASWALIGPHHRVFFCGDSGLFRGLTEIGQQRGPFDVSLMPIGAYTPAAPHVHMNPEESVVAHRHVQGRLLLPIHWGTFFLGPHGWIEPAKRLLIAARAAGVPVVIPHPGQSIDPSALKEGHYCSWPICADLEDE